ncbi:MAG TPA: hypothetical protein VKK19_19695 [Candidatus Dormibacteraeota bacterium]|nr:hypothetical protein [Candidatus Dormibacteraeota bacterium]
MNLAVFLHAFGARYDLPISVALYLFAAASVVVVSFVMVAIFAGERVGERAVRYPRLRAPLLLAIGRTAVFRAISGTVGVLALLAIIVTGFFGNQNPARNPAEYLTWIYFWAGLVILSGLVGNIWTLVNPWSAIFDLVTWGRRPRPPLRLPDRVGVWPAAGVYLLFALFELASGVANRPWLVASLAVIYTVVTLVGMALFGRDQWLQSCEGFTVLFSVVGRFGPVETQRDEDGRLQAVWLRPWGTGLLQRQRGGWDWVVFVILMLSSLAFDGIIATGAWMSFADALAPWVQPLGAVGTALVRAFGMLLLATAFLLIFTAFVRMMLFFGGGRVDEVATVTAFALTLVPIALVYNAAHNYSYLTVQSQMLIPLLADPLGNGWNLLPTQGYQPSFALTGAATVWYMQIILIVLGHVIAVYLAHLRAGERFRSAQRVLLSQYPMLVLMVLYTMTSLWILAQPITRGG